MAKQARLVFILAIPALADAARMTRKSANGTSSDRWTQAAMPCLQGSAAMTTAHMTSADYDAVYASVASLYASLSMQCNATFCPQSDFTGCILRAAGHDFMDFKGTTGGSDGCLDMHDEDNNGLHDCLYEGEFGVSLKQAYQEHCTKVSLADFLVIAGETAISLTRENVLREDASRQSIDFKSSFMYGRTTAETCEWALGRLPNPEHGCPATEETMVRSMGLTWREVTALMGVHTLGRAEIRHSGYNGFWSDAQNSRLFNNNFYLSILNKGWQPEVVNGNPNKVQWKRTDDGTDEQRLGKEQMLNTDLCLAFDGVRRSELNAGEALRNNQPCCAWRFASDEWFNPPGNNYFVEGEIHCGNDFYFTELWAFGEQRAMCCGTVPMVDCGDSFELGGKAFDDVKEFTYDERSWLQTFLVAWRKATSNGASNLKPLQ